MKKTVTLEYSLEGAEIPEIPGIGFFGISGIPARRTEINPRQPDAGI
jgi:hypothetical protein